MPVPNRSYSYPYRSIATAFDVPYALILLAADHLSDKSTPHTKEAMRQLRLMEGYNYVPMVKCVVAENNFQHRVRNGEVRFDAEPC